MPASSLDPERLLGAAARLARTGDAAGEAADEMLDHLVMLGQHEAQAAVDQCLEQAADTLRALEDEVLAVHQRLTAAARRAGETEDSVDRAVAAAAEETKGYFT